MRTRLAAQKQNSIISNNKLASKRATRPYSLRLATSAKARARHQLTLLQPVFSSLRALLWVVASRLRLLLMLSSMHLPIPSALTLPQLPVDGL